METLRTLLLTAPDSQLDAALKPIIEKWAEPPTAIQVLEVLDKAINGSLASGMMVKVLQALYDIACDNEGTNHEEIVKQATWRK